MPGIWHIEHGTIFRSPSIGLVIDIPRWDVGRVMVVFPVPISLRTLVCQPDPERSRMTIN